MSGVWVFRDGKVKLAQNPPPEPEAGTTTTKRKALVHTESGDVVSSYEMLESMLEELDWERYYGADDDSLLQFRKRGGSLGTISLPKDFARFGPEHMYDIVLKNRDAFRVIDVVATP